MIPIAAPCIGKEEENAVISVLQSGMIASGEIVSRFEEEFSRYIGVSHSVATSSGTSALHATLIALGISPGDEVIVPSFTFIATATAVSMCGAMPVMVDVNKKTFTIDPESVQEAITERTKGVIGVHLFGQACDINALYQICEDHSLLFIEDCAQAHGTEYKDKKVGSHGDAGCFSFYPTKNMTTGEGGMITSENLEFIDHCRRIINHGQKERYLHTELGYNYRMTNINAAIGRVQLQKLGEMNQQRQNNANVYSSYLKTPGIIHPACQADSTHVYHQYAILVDEAYPITRDALVTYLADHGVGTAIHYPIPVHRQPLYQNTSGAICPVSEWLSNHILSLPVHSGVTTDQCRQICSIIDEVN